MSVTQTSLGSQTIDLAKRFSPGVKAYLIALGKQVGRQKANLAVFAEDGDLLWLSEAGGFKTAKRHLAEIARHLASRTPGDVEVSAGPTTALACTVDLVGQGRVVVVIDLGQEQTFPGLGSMDARAAPRRSFMAQMLDLAAEGLHLVARAEQETQQVSGELAQAYEELVLLHKIGVHMALTEKDSDFLTMICESIYQVLPVEGVAILLNKTGCKEHLPAVAASAGQVHLGQIDLGQLHQRLLAELKAGKEALVDCAAGRYNWPSGIRNIMAVPVFGKDPGACDPLRSWLGLIVVVNCMNKDQFDSTDMKLLSSVGAVCGVFIANGRLFGDLKDLLLGLLVALAQGIDAKDEYTLGHSERVAFISRWIAEQLARKGNLDARLVHVAYFAGLLHDVGKIGVDDWVLRKTSSLTESEWLSIRRHPVIGAGILRQIRQMQQVLPAVLSHHERVDGSGYPQGLKADQIPLIARIVGLADSFDAMTSRRSYRPAKDLQQAIEEIRANSGRQFDPEVASAFLESDLDRLWELLSHGPDRLCHGLDTSYYPAAAVEALVR